MQLTAKETALLKDLKDQEKLCAEKYARSADCAKDPQLKNLFTQLSQTEQGHLNSLNTMETGACPQPAGGGGQQPTFTASYNTAETPDKKNDCFLCSDLLTAEKHASGLYDTCIFEFRDKCARDLLNSIQKQEQGHGKAIYDYMAANNMYA